MIAHAKIIKKYQEICHAGKDGKLQGPYLFSKGLNYDHL
jgi:hypothetical protein